MILPSVLCQPPWVRVRLRTFISRSVTAQSGPCKRASTTSRRPICSDGTVLSGAKKSISVLSLCRRISFRRRLSTTQLPSALRRALPASEPRATSAPRLVSVTIPLSISPSITALLVGTPLSVREPAFTCRCVFLPSTLPASGVHGEMLPLTRCALNSQPVSGLLKAMLLSCRRSAAKGSGALDGERFNVPSCSRIVSTCSGSVTWRVLRPMSTALATSVAGLPSRPKVTFLNKRWEGDEKR